MIQEAGRPSLPERIDSLCHERRIWFGPDHRFILYTPSQLRSDGGFVELQRALKDAAWHFLQAGKLDDAYKFATMGVSIGRHLLERCAGRHRVRGSDAGDVDCRLVRAHVLIRRGALEAARGELEKAESLAHGRGRNRWRESIRQARTALREASRPDG